MAVNCSEIEDQMKKTTKCVDAVERMDSDCLPRLSQRREAQFLGNPHTGDVVTVAEHVSAAMSVIPDAGAISFVDQSDETVSRLMRLELKTRAITPVPDRVERGSATAACCTAMGRS